MKVGYQITSRSAPPQISAPVHQNAPGWCAMRRRPPVRHSPQIQPGFQNRPGNHAAAPTTLCEPRSKPALQRNRALRDEAEGGGGRLNPSKSNQIQGKNSKQTTRLVIQNPASENTHFGTNEPIFTLKSSPTVPKRTQIHATCGEFSSPFAIFASFALNPYPPTLQQRQPTKSNVIQGEKSKQINKSGSLPLNPERGTLNSELPLWDRSSPVKPGQGMPL